MSAAANSPSSHWAKDAAEEDRVETLIRNSGCWEQHVGVVDCMGDKRDWRECQLELNTFKNCMIKGREAAQKKPSSATSPAKQ